MAGDIGSSGPREGSSGRKRAAESVRRPGVPLATAILVIGVLVSLVGGREWQGTERRQEAQAFATQATQISTTLDALLGHDTDFLAALQATLTVHPDLSQGDFQELYDQLEGTQRQVGAIGTTFVRPVRAHQLRQFLSWRTRDPTLRALVAGRWLPFRPRGGGPYCLASVSASPAGVLRRPLAAILQGDWCDGASAIGGSQMAMLRLATDTGELAGDPTVTEGISTMVVTDAVYRHGAGLGDPATRRAALIGWIATSFDVQRLLRTVLTDHPELELAVYNSNPLSRASTLVASTGGRRPHAYREWRVLPDERSWMLRVGGALPAVGVAAMVQGLVIALTGCVLSTLLAAIVLLLARSRDAALTLVRARTSELEHIAMHDALTGLPNRLLAIDRGGQMFARIQRGGPPVVAVYLDLDGFKSINDTFGHPSGDLVLREAGARIQSAIRDADTPARLGGDEFVVLTEMSGQASAVEGLAARLHLALSEPYELGGGSEERAVTLTVSIGIAKAVSGSIEALLADADIALNTAKQSGRDRTVFFEPRMRNVARDRLSLQMDLVHALARGEMSLVYQPIMDLSSRRIVAAESLLRWLHPTRGPVPPDEFIPVAEESDLIVALGRWVLQAACWQAARWHQSGHQLSVAVNVSARQLDDDGLLRDVSCALEETHLPAHYLTIEVTETAIMRDGAASSRRLGELKRQGVQIAIDDFGIGYSSLAQLRALPVDLLKIDRAFVAEITTSSASLTLLQTLVQLGRDLGLRTLAEGIETEAQREMLVGLECELGQGFLFSRPLDPGALDDFLKGSETPQRADTAMQSAR